MRGPSHRAPAGLARHRSCLYRLLATAFAPPTPIVVRRLASGGAARAALSLARAVVVPGVDTTLTALVAGLAEWRRRAPTQVAQELGREYQRLFAGPYHLEAPPYESCYRSPGGAVMGESAVAVLRSYEAAGFLLHPAIRDLPDHIALELLFLGLLAGEEERRWRDGHSPALAACLAREERFLVDHLATWVGPFAGRVAAAGGSPFYATLAAATEAYVAADRALVGALREVLP